MTESRPRQVPALADMCVAAAACIEARGTSTLALDRLPMHLAQTIEEAVVRSMLKYACRNPEECCWACTFAAGLEHARCQASGRRVSRAWQRLAKRDGYDDPTEIGCPLGPEVKVREDFIKQLYPLLQKLELRCDQAHLSTVTFKGRCQLLLMRRAVRNHLHKAQLARRDCCRRITCRNTSGGLCWVPLDALAKDGSWQQALVEQVAALLDKHPPLAYGLQPPLCCEAQLCSKRANHELGSMLLYCF